MDNARNLALLQLDSAAESGEEEEELKTRVGQS